MANRAKKVTPPAAGGVNTEKEVTAQSSVIVDQEKASKKPEVGQIFETDEGTFRFIVGRFNCPGFGVFTSEEAVEVEGEGEEETYKHGAMLAYLVKEKSGVIELVK